MTGDARETSNGSLILGLAAVLFAVAILPFVLEDDSPGSPAAITAATATLPGGLSATGLFDNTARPNTRETTPRSATPRSAPTYERPAAPPQPTRRTDPREEAFKAVAQVGTCLNAYQLGYPDGRWNSEVPRPALCGTWQAFSRVVGVNGSCPTGGDGYATWGYGSVRLCLERQFQQGQCFLVSREGGTKSEPRYSAGLFTWIDCKADRIPADYDSILVITSVYKAPKTITQGMCRRAANDATYYWYWFALDNSVLVCATYPDR